jgi:thiol-disulfide isomerase/thioredoxin
MLKKITIISFLLILMAFQSIATASNGKAIDIVAYQGKVVLVDFWASWCAPCRKSFPWLNEMQEKYGSQGLIILGVNVDENSQDAKQFLKENPAVFNLIYDPKGQHATYYEIPGMPTTLIFNRQGELHHKHAGFKVNKIQEYEQAIIQALAVK